MYVYVIVSDLVRILAQCALFGWRATPLHALSYNTLNVLQIKLQHLFGVSDVVTIPSTVNWDIARFLPRHSLLLGRWHIHPLDPLPEERCFIFLRQNKIRPPYFNFLPGNHFFPSEEGERTRTLPPVLKCLLPPFER